MLTAALPLLLPRTTPTLRIHRQRQPATAKLRPIPLTYHSALVVSDLRAGARQRVAAEALPPVFRASDAVTLGITVAHTARRRRVVRAEVRKLDAG